MIVTIRRINCFTDTAQSAQDSFFPPQRRSKPYLSPYSKPPQQIHLLDLLGQIAHQQIHIPLNNVQTTMPQDLRQRHHIAAIP